MHDLSVIIVNYNVKNFLEQALLSVQKAIKNLDVEIFVVDNASSDDSCEMVKDQFPKVNLIESETNLGFAKANNLAIRKSNARHILLLNPDTIIEENTLSSCVSYLDKNPDVGALGVKMLDGSGAFLPESKRGFPDPIASFFKLSGIYRLFPKSAFFNKYYAGQLSKEETNEIDVLCGAFMMIPSKVLNQVGLLDEAYFMYGEDIDLSYRIQKAGFKNIYFSDTKIIHYKGESTKKDSFRYVKIFYESMIIFAKKHLGNDKKGFYIAFLTVGIYLRGIMSLFKRVFSRIAHPLADFSLIFLGLFLIKGFWADFKFGNPDYYNNANIHFNFILYSLIWTFLLFMQGAYDSKFNLKELIKSIFFGTILILAIYGLLNLNYRSSRAIILLGMIWAVSSSFFTQILNSLVRRKGWMPWRKQEKRSLIVGSIEECRRTAEIIKRMTQGVKIYGNISVDENPDTNVFIGGLSNLKHIAESNQIDQIIFCAKDISSGKIMDLMASIGGKPSYRIIPQEGQLIIGSDSKNTLGEYYSVNIQYNVAQQKYLRQKRFLDVVLSFVFLMLSPLILLIQKNKMQYLSNTFMVLANKRSWVGYHPEDEIINKLPKIKASILHPQMSNVNLEQSELHRMNLKYAKDYNIWKDIEVISSNFNNLSKDK